MACDSINIFAFLMTLLLAAIWNKYWLYWRNCLIFEFAYGTGNQGDVLVVLLPPVDIPLATVGDIPGVRELDLVPHPDHFMLYVAPESENPVTHKTLKRHFRSMFLDAMQKESES